MTARDSSDEQVDGRLGDVAGLDEPRHERLLSRREGDRSPGRPPPALAIGVARQRRGRPCSPGSRRGAYVAAIAVDSAIDRALRGRIGVGREQLGDRVGGEDARHQDDRPAIVPDALGGWASICRTTAPQTSAWLREVELERPVPAVGGQLVDRPIPEPTTAAAGHRRTGRRSARSARRAAATAASTSAGSVRSAAR